LLVWGGAAIGHVVTLKGMLKAGPVAGAGGADHRTRKDTRA
jgi:hypothetical protein